MIRILITNDDGIHSDGLIKLEEALKEVGDVYVVAPASEMSGASHSLTLARPLRIRQVTAVRARSTAPPSFRGLPASPRAWDNVETI